MIWQSSNRSFRVNILHLERLVVFRYFVKVGGDVLFKRNHPEIRKIWNSLCKAHMKAMVICIDRPPRDSKMAKLCDEIERPRACIEALHLSEEETCCGRFMNRIGESKA